MANWVPLSKAAEMFGVSDRKIRYLANTGKVQLKSMRSEHSDRRCQHLDIDALKESMEFSTKKLELRDERKELELEKLREEVEAKRYKNERACLALVTKGRDLALNAVYECFSDFAREIPNLDLTEEQSNEMQRLLKSALEKSLSKMKEQINEL